MTTFLIVCTANICRSPMAEGILCKKIQEHPHFQGWRVSSAGTWGRNGLPAAPEAIEVLERRGIDISEHRSRIITPEIIQAADLILTMENGHREALVVEFPEKRQQIRLITELVGASYDIEDPIGKPLAEFEKLAQEFDRMFDKMLITMQKRAGQRSEDKGNA
jgi:protein-tyrosine phosphatase